MNRRKAAQAEMTPLMVVMPQEMLQDPQAGLGAARPVDRVAFIVDGFDKTLDFAVRRWRMGSNEPMLDA